MKLFKIIQKNIQEYIVCDTMSEIFTLLPIDTNIDIDEKLIIDKISDSIIVKN